MKFQLTSTPLYEIKTDCLIVPVFTKQRGNWVATALDEKAQGAITKVIENGDINGELRQTLLLQAIPNIAAKRILLVGCGPAHKIDAETFKQIVGTSIQAIKNTDIKHITSTLHTMDIKEHDANWQIRQFIISMTHHTYQFNQFITKPIKTSKISDIHFWLSDTLSMPQARLAIKEGCAFANGISLCKDLANMPANICTPEFLEKQAFKLASSFSSISVETLDEAEMKKQNMNAFLSISQSSKHPGRMIVMHYQHDDASNQPPIVLIGKGITFDTGGLQLKPAASMLSMKLDMCGAATLFGVMKAIAELKLPLNVIVMIAAAENMIGRNSIRPSDVIKTHAGKTIEIISTDAEGRLVMCDALSFCEIFNPAVVIDVATLTTAVISALGSVYSGLFSNHPPLAKSLIKAGVASADKVWQLPIEDEAYRDLLKSNIADLTNASSISKEAGAITAACFLATFTKKYQWAHIDIAGTANVRSNHQPTGRCVPLLLQYLINYANQMTKE
ncbi:MAG: leucyl aminopeptidase [Gammaproteobacteria bacterium]|nr:leucyl aminopeptidase [Gammaproteobacteria bacterium]